MQSTTWGECSCTPTASNPPLITARATVVIMSHCNMTLSNKSSLLQKAEHFIKSNSLGCTTKDHHRVHFRRIGVKEIVCQGPTCDNAVPKKLP